jgi:hypothetical protein
MGSLLNFARRMFQLLRAVREARRDPSKVVVAIGMDRREFLRLTTAAGATALLPVGTVGPATLGVNPVPATASGVGLSKLVIGDGLLSTTMYVVMKEWREALHEEVGFLAVDKEDLATVKQSITQPLDSSMLAGVGIYNVILPGEDKQ